jgi:hypothetical protein
MMNIKQILVRARDKRRTMDYALAERQIPFRCILCMTIADGSSFVQLAGYRSGKRDDGSSGDEFDNGRGSDRHRYPLLLLSQC